MINWFLSCIDVTFALDFNCFRNSPSLAPAVGSPLANELDDFLLIITFGAINFEAAASVDAKDGTASEDMDVGKTDLGCTTTSIYCEGAK